VGAARGDRPRARGGRVVVGAGRERKIADGLVAFVPVLSEVT
jgi:hypothetical protein